MRGRRARLLRGLTCAAGLALAAAAPASAEANAIPNARAAVFHVGAAVADIDPSYPVYMGGYGGGPSGGTIARHIDPLTGQPEHFTVRAISIEAHGHVVELATVDTQGYFAGYQEGPYGISDVRQAAAAYLAAHGVPGAGPQDIVVSSEHEHASPTLLGIWGPPEHQLPYLKQVAQTLTAVLERAYAAARPATITWGAGDDPWVSDRVIAEGNAFEGWPRDGSLGALWARDAHTGATIATYVTEPGYPNIVYGPGDLLGPNGQAAAVLSSDFPNYADAYLEQRLGGIAIVTQGTLGNQTSALQTDNAASPDLPPLGADHQTRAFDDIIHFGQLFAQLTLGALAHGHVITSATVASAEQKITTPVYNPILITDAKVAPIVGSPFWSAVTGGALYPTDRSFSGPYGDGLVSISTWVTSLRIGELLFTTMPGEFFPSTHATWLRSIHGPQGNFVIGAAQDFLGYEYPVYAYPFTLEGSDEGIFNPSLTLGDQVVTAGEQNAQALGFSADTTSSAEYTALENQYLAATQPGVQFIPFPQSGDLGAGGRGFAPTIEGISEPPRVGSTLGICLADTLTACPTPPPSMGSFVWNFGDGTSASTPPQSYARAYYSPFIHHLYCRPGHYVVTVTATDASGNTNGMSLPVVVYPEFSLAVRRHGSRLRLRAHGGDGSVLYATWRHGTRVAHGLAFTLPRGRGTLTVRALDGTGTPSALRIRYAHGRPLRVTPVVAGGLLPLADGASATRCPATPRRVSSRGRRAL